MTMQTYPILDKQSGQPFAIVLEPYGDNSRYWIGPKEPAENALDVGDIENAFKAYRPPLHRKILGDVLTLRLFKRLAGRA